MSHPFARRTTPLNAVMISSVPALNRPERSRALLVLLTLATLSPPALALEPWTAPESATAAKNPIAASKAAVDKGRELYAKRCADCHGKKGRGDGGGGADLERRPTDLTVSTVQSQTDGALFWKITEGRRPMPAYSRKLSEEQRWQVVHYLRSFASKPNPKPAGRN